ncbi:hypothetical protein [Streptacidiphilus cavernicola]|uniref:FtsK domain-containing protein n=1 Tax=Streptacidiphilus cavernicola TaxID=3342716 RepID=A0ABV6VXT2_9ACTN
MNLDWDAKHGAVTGAINTATATLAAASVEHAAHLPLWSAGLLAGAGLLGTHVAGLRMKVSGATLGLRAATWMAAGAWCSWAAVEGPWTRNVLVTLAAGALGLGGAMAGAHHVEEKQAEQQAAAEAAVKRASMDWKRQRVADEWDQRLATVCTGSTAHVIGVEEWETGGGYTLDTECLGGTRWRDLKTFEEALAAEARLPEGCGVEVKAGAHRGAALIDVATVNRLIGEDPYPTEYSPLTLTGPLPLGLHRDGSDLAPNIRELTTLLAGRKGSGKTNLSNVFLAGLCRMPDNLTWIIDLNGGGLALAWLHAWHQAGRPGQPPVDWVADTPDKALAMATAALRIAKARKPGYKHLEIAANTDKLPVSPQVPGILIAGDEIAEIYSPKARRDPVLRETGDVLIQVVELARAAAVNALVTALRATQDVLSEPQLLAQSGLKIGMKSDEREMSYLFGWSDRISPEDAPYPGCGFAKVLDEPARPFKAYRMLPNQIADIVRATSQLHPELDDLSRRAAGEAYEKRWEHTDHLFGLGTAPEQAITTTAERQAPERPRGSGVTAGWGTEPAGPDAQAAIDEAEATRQRLHKAVGEAADHDADLDRQFQQILEGGGALWKPPTPDAPSDHPVMPTPGIIDDARWLTVFTIVAKAGPAGINPAAIAEFFAAVSPVGTTVPSRSAITDWLKKEPKVHQPSTGRYALRTEEM